MTIPSGLREFMKKEILTRRKQFNDKVYLILSANVSINYVMLAGCLESGEKLLNDYDGLYLTNINDPSVKHLTGVLCYYREKCKKTYGEFENNSENFNLFQLLNIIEIFSNTVERYEDMITSMGFKDFEIKN